jgi:predicted phosphodiesterase
MIKFKSNTIACVGDTHGVGPFYKLLDWIPNGTDIVHVGDLGVGFCQDAEQVRAFVTLSSKLAAKHCRVFVVRGNHDNPKWWPLEFDDTIYLVEDYSEAKFPNGEFALFVGGGFSVDRFLRVVDISYWKNEVTPEPPEGLGRYDVVFAHDCPSYVNNDTQGLVFAFPYFVKKDRTLLDEAEEQRLVLDSVAEITRPKWWLYGHFHNSRRQEKRGTFYQCLDISRTVSFNTEDGIEDLEEDHSL